HRDNTVRRWAVDLQNDFRTRLDWCVKSVKEANHPPRVVVNGVTGTEVIRLMPAVGSDLKLDASGSGDSDGGRLNFNWFVYSEAGSYFKTIQIDGAASQAVTVHVPGDAGGKE